MDGLTTQLKNLNARIERQRLYDGTWYKVVGGCGGSMLILTAEIGEAVAAAGGSPIAEVRLMGRTDATTYTGDVYANGNDAAATETGVTIKVHGMAATAVLPTGVNTAGSWFHATKQPWAGVSTWTIILGIPRWL
jgi:hypothetical protein